MDRQQKDDFDKPNKVLVPLFLSCNVGVTIIYSIQNIYTKLGSSYIYIYMGFWALSGLALSIHFEPFFDWI